MAKVMVCQHVPFEPLGTLDPLIKGHRHRIRYINFGREPHARPTLEGYDALILLGGPMNIGQEDKYPHLEVEKELVREAMALGLPVLGICLGAQLIASALGAEVKPAAQKEFGWYQLAATEHGQQDPLIRHFQQQEFIFQWHGYTFDLPDTAQLLVTGDGCQNQAFKINNNIYGFQYHLEANLPLIQRWLRMPEHVKELSHGSESAERIWNETLYRMERSLALSRAVFNEFLALLPPVKSMHQFYHREFRCPSY